MTENALSFAPVTAPEPVTVDPMFGRLGPALALLPVQSVHLVTVETGGGLLEGIELVDRSVDGGAAAFAVESVLDDIPALAVLAVLLNLEPIAALGTASQPRWAERLVALRALLPSLRAHVQDPAALLEAAGDSALTTLTGVLAQAAVRRTPVLFGGSPSVVAAAVLADRLAPGSAAWWLAAEAPIFPAATTGLAHLGLAPLLDLRVARRGVPLALAVIRAAGGA